MARKIDWAWVDKVRTEALNRMVPDLYTYRSILYVGANSARFDYGEEFRKRDYEITVLEVFKANAAHVRTIPWVHEVIECDVRDFESNKKYDIVFWWHGPEYIPKEDLQKALGRLEKVAGVAVVLGCPWGRAHFSLKRLGSTNPHDEHVAHHGEGVFEKFGYKAAYTGKKSRPGSGIVAVKRMKI